MYKFKISESLLIISIVFLGLSLRIFYLDQPMRFDESATFFNYVNTHWSQVFNYTAPNNQVLNTILVKLTTALWGGHPFVIRLPALFFGTASIPLIYLVCKRLGCGGYIAALILAVHPYCILFSTNARGYSAIVFFTLLFLLIAEHTVKQFNRTSIFKLALIGALGLLTIPIMLFPLFGLTSWLVLQLIKRGTAPRKVLYQFLLPFVLLGFAMSLALYAPVVWVTMRPFDSLAQALGMLFNNEFVKATDSEYFFRTIRAHVTNAISIYRKDIPTPALLLFFSLIAAAFFADYRERSFRITQLVLTVVISTVILFLLKHQMPYPRTWIFFIPIFAIAADRGFTFLTKALRMNPHSFVLVLALLCVNTSFHLMAKKSVHTYADTGTYLDAEVMAKKLASLLHEGDEVISPIIPANLPIYFYLWHERAYHKALKTSGSVKNTYIVMPSDDIKLEMFSLPPHPIDTKLEIVSEDNAVKIFEFNGSAIYKAIVKPK
jgi:hypothetical protein